MAVKVNFNEAAAQTHTALIRNERAMNKSLLRLSTGTRILNAADDSAGLFIADMLGTVAKAYEQGNRNIQTGISALQIAEASAGQIYDKLQEIYVRAQNAANDINDPNARNALQREIKNFVDAIQKIGTDTEYNGIKLLDGTFSGKYIHYGPRMDQVVNVNVSGLRAQDLGAYVATANGATSSISSSVTGGTLDNFVTSQASSEFLLSGTGDYVKVANITVYQGAASTTRLVDAATLVKNINSNIDLQKLGIEATAKNESVANALYDPNTLVTRSGTGEVNLKLNFYIGDGTTTFQVNLGNVSGTGTTEGGRTIATLDDLVNRINTQAQAVNANITAINDGGKLKLVTQNGETIGLEVVASAVSGTSSVTVDLSQLIHFGSDVSTRTVSLTDIASGTTQYAQVVKTGSVHIAGIDSFKLDYNGVSGASNGNKGLDFQIASGNNAGRQDLNSIDVTTNAGAERALLITKMALQKVDTERAKIGATMNNLQSIFDSQKVAYDNTKEAESTIRNTDYAKEMSEFTTYQIRMQSTIAMLGQANTLPQLVLQLLR